MQKRILIQYTKKPKYISLHKLEMTSQLVCLKYNTFEYDFCFSVDVKTNFFISILDNRPIIPILDSINNIRILISIESFDFSLIYGMRYIW